jgi:ribosomal protein L40E
MPEALTESFCERCGTRYEFAAPTQLNTMRKTRGLISGLKNYIMSQDALSDAVGDAMRSEEETLAAQQLDAFHESFNFCINCRQYTCVNCWNDDAGRCRTCVPIAGTDDLLERFEATFQAQHPELAAAAAEADLAQADLNRRLGLDAWPSEDLPVGAGNGNGHAAEAEWPSEELLPAASAETVEPEPEPEPMVAEQPEPAPEPLVAEQPKPEPEPMVAETVEEYPALRVLTWEEDTTFELEPEPVVAEAEPKPEPEPEPVVAEAEPEPEPEPVAPQAPQPIRPISETILRMPQPSVQPPAPAEEERVAAQSDDPLAVARRAQLDLLGLGDPGEGALAPDRKVLPYRSSGASVHPIEAAVRTASGLPVPGAFWDASAREVAGAMSHVGVQACGECGLSLSASARFCRRCGTRQARSA